MLETIKTLGSQPPFLPEGTTSFSEQDQNTFSTVPVSYTEANGEIVEGNYTFIGRVWGAEDAQNCEGILSDHPEIALDFLERGVACLDDYIPKDADLVIHLLRTDISNKRADTNGVAKTLVLHPNRTFTITRGKTVAVEPFAIEPLRAHVAVDSGAVIESFGRQFSDVIKTGLTRYDGSPVSEKYPVLLEKLETLGIVSGTDIDRNNARDFLTLPTVLRIQDIFNYLAQEDSTSGVFYPDLQFANGGQFDGTTFISAWADLNADGLGKYIVASDELEYFAHDTAAEHLIALMAGGRPMMQVLSRFASVVLAAKQLDLPKVKWQGELVTLEGRNKDDRAALIIDGFTEEFNSVVGDAGNADGRSISYSPTNINGLVKTLREAGQLDDLEVVRFMIDSKMVDSTDEITELQILQALDLMAQSRFQKIELEE